MNQDLLDRFAQPFVRRLTRRVAVRRFAGAGLATAATLALAAPGARAGQATPLVATSVSAPDALPGGLMSQATPAADAPLTVVLVHGAFADASGWAGVITGLQAAGVAVMAPANPLRSVSGDAAYVASVVNQIPGPVLLVGHSYGGMVISSASTQADNVVGLVYVAAFIPEEGESVQSLAEQATDSLLGPALRPAHFPTEEGPDAGVELYIDQAAFHEAFCADLPAEEAAAMAVSQRPGGALGFGEPAGTVGWKTLPTWAVVATADLTIGVTGERFMAERAGAEILEVDASHVVMMSQPQAVTDFILTAVAAVS